MSSFAEQLQDALGPSYQLERELHGGGMSRVFLARDLSLNRPVVVKVLPPELAAGVNRERFRREIQLAAQLQHPHIVPLLSAGESGDLLWYTMPFIEGESLRAAVERGREFGAREVCRIMHDVLDPLAFAHARGVIHRDIKPGNILTQGNHALVTDFGVAKAISAALPLSGATSAGIAIGTPAYMAPEQLAGDPAADHRLDLYAVGLLAYELLTGSSPFASSSPRETMAAQLTRDPQPLHEVTPSVPPALSDLVMRLLAKDPEARPTSAERVLEELDGIVIPALSTPTNGGVPARRGRRVARQAVLGTAIAATALAMVYLGTRDRSTVLPMADPDTAVAASGAMTVVAPSGEAVAVVDDVPVSIPTPVLTRDDSIAIAATLNRQVAQARTMDSASEARLRDSLRTVIERRLLDSIAAAYSARPSTPVQRRVAITEPRPVPGWPDASLLARVVADSLRAMMPVRRYVVVPRDSVRLALEKSRTPSTLSQALGAEVLVSIALMPLPRDSAMLQLTVHEPGPRGFSQRVATTRGARSEILGDLDAVLRRTMGYLEESSRPRALQGATPQVPQVQRFTLPGRGGATGASATGAGTRRPPPPPPPDSQR